VTTPESPPTAKPSLARSPLLPTLVTGGIALVVAFVQLYCPGRTEGPCAKVGRIALYSPQGADDARWKAIRKVLDAEDCPLGATQKATHRRRPEIRFFHPRDRAAAESLSALLVRENVTDAVPKFQPDEADEKPAGQLELWLDRAP
jgi:hypothetical protein